LDGGLASEARHGVSLGRGPVVHGAALEPPRRPAQK
jgi:hypothetical protein